MGREISPPEFTVAGWGLSACGGTGCTAAALACRETGVAISSLMEALVEQYAAHGVLRHNPAPLLKRTLRAQFELRLLLESADLAIAPLVSSASEAVLNGSPLESKVIQSLTSVLTAWRRGQVSGWGALDLYRRDTGIEVFTRMRSAIGRPIKCA